MGAISITGFRSLNWLYKGFASEAVMSYSLYILNIRQSFFVVLKYVHDY